MFRNTPLNCLSFREIVRRDRTFASAGQNPEFRSCDGTKNLGAGTHPSESRSWGRPRIGACPFFLLLCSDFCLFGAGISASEHLPCNQGFTSCAVPRRVAKTSRLSRRPSLCMLVFPVVAHLVRLGPTPGPCGHDDDGARRDACAVWSRRTT